MTILDDLLNKISSVIDKIKSYPLQKALDDIPYNTEDYRYDELLKTWVPKDVNIEEFYGIQIALDKLSDSISQANKGVKSIGNVLGAGKSISGIFPTLDFLFNQITVKIYTSAGALNFFDLEIQITDSSTTQAELLKTHIIEGDRVCLRTFTFNPTHDINYYFMNNGGSEIILDYIFTFSELEQKNTITLDSRVNPSSTITRQFMKYGSMFNRMRILFYESDTINGNYTLTHKTNSSSMSVELLNENVTTSGNNYNAKHSFNEASFLELAITNNDAVKYLYFQIILFFSMSADDTAYNEVSWDKNLDSATKNVIRDWIQAHLIPNIHHTPTVAGDLSHNSLANLNDGVSYEHITQAQKDVLHSVLTNLNELGTRNHSDLQNKNTEENIKHLSDAQVGALHGVLTNLTQLATRNHNDLLNINAGTDYEHITQVQKDALKTLEQIHAYIEATALVLEDDLNLGEHDILGVVDLFMSGNIIAGGSLTLGAGAELGGDLDLNEHNIKMDIALDSNGEYEGIIRTMTVDENTFGFGGLLHLQVDGHYDDASNSAIGDMPCSAIAVESGTGSKKIMKIGFIRCDTWNFTVGEPVIVGDNGTAISITALDVGDYTQIVGIAESADSMYFNPALDYVKRK